jgi:WD repeat and SOF domain-containing protein 1
MSCSAADDTNVRIWRAVANERGTPLLPREKKKREYSAALVEKHKHLPEVRRIKNHVHLPKRILKAALVKDTVRGTQKKREKNRRAHSAPGTVPRVERKKKQVWAVQE